MATNTSNPPTAILGMDVALYVESGNSHASSHSNNKESTEDIENTEDSEDSKDTEDVENTGESKDDEDKGVIPVRIIRSRTPSNSIINQEVLNATENCTSPLNFINLKTLVELQRFPQLKEGHTKLLTDIDRDNSLLIFMSYFHVENNPPDIVVCLHGIRKLCEEYAPKVPNCYVWIDHCCLPPASIYKNLTLPSILQYCDIVFTPFVDINDYKADGWNRLETISAFFTPLVNYCYYLRFASRFIRPHFVHDVYAMANNDTPALFTLMPHNVGDFNPLSGIVNVNDRRVVRKLVSDLENNYHIPFHEPLVIKYIKNPSLPAILLLGFSGCGKSSLVRSLCKVSTDTFYVPTKDCDVYYCHDLRCYLIDCPGFEMDSEATNIQIKNQIRKVAQDRFHVAGVIMMLMFRSNREHSGYKVPSWLKFVTPLSRDKSTQFCILADVSGGSKPAPHKFPNFGALANQQALSANSNQQVPGSETSFHYQHLRFSDEYNLDDVAALHNTLFQKIAERKPVALNCATPFIASGFQSIQINEDEVVGRGVSSVVYIGKFCTEKVAVKVFLKGPTYRLDLITNELEIHKSVRHIPGVIRLYGGYLVNEPRLVLELANGSLFTALHMNKMIIDMTIKAKLDYAMQIAKTIDAIHSAGIIHRDIKSANILFVKYADRIVMKIADFGIACTTPIDNGAQCGTPSYMAPENFSGSYSPASDVYAFGITLNELLTEKQPFYGVSEELLIDAVVNKNQRPTLFLSNGGETGNRISYVIQFCLQEIPRKRMTMKDVISNLQSIQDNFKNGPLPKMQSTLSSNNLTGFNPPSNAQTKIIDYIATLDEAKAVDLLSWLIETVPQLGTRIARDSKLSHARNSLTIQQLLTNVPLIEEEFDLSMFGIAS